jgi:hypothetical protein
VLKNLRNPCTNDISFLDLKDEPSREPGMPMLV